LDRAAARKANNSCFTGDCGEDMIYLVIVVASSVSLIDGVLLKNLNPPYFYLSINLLKSKIDVKLKSNDMTQ